MPSSNDQNNKSEQANQGLKQSQNRFKSSFYYLIGTIFFIIGLVGIFVPLLPTTIFWIIAAVIFAKGHPHLRDKIYQWPVIGETVSSFVEQGSINAKSKRIAILGIITIGGLSLYLSQPSDMVMGGTSTLLLIVMIYIYTRPENSD